MDILPLIDEVREDSEDEEEERAEREERDIQVFYSHASVEYVYATEVMEDLLCEV